MKRKLFILKLITIVLITSYACSNNNEVIVIKPITIDIIPFENIPMQDVEFVAQEIKKIVASVNIKPKENLPQQAYYAARNRYRADTLIGFLSKQTESNHVSIGLTTHDISHTNGKIKDFGIFGLGFKPGNACVVSSYRLSKENKNEQFFKVCIHELGHTAGLPHCPEKTCFMRDAEGKNPTNEEIEFCEKCKTFLISKGWNLK